MASDEEVKLVAEAICCPEGCRHKGERSPAFGLPMCSAELYRGDATRLLAALDAHRGKRKRLMDWLFERG